MISEATELRWLVASATVLPLVVMTATLVDVSTRPGMSALIFVTPCGSAAIVCVMLLLVLLLEHRALLALEHRPR